MSCTQEEQALQQEASPISSKEEVLKEEMKSVNNKSCNNSTSSSMNNNNSLLTAALTSTATTKQMRRLNKQKKTLYMCKRELVKPLRYRRNFEHLLKNLVIPSVESVQLEILQHQRERKHLLHRTELHEIFVTENVKRVVLDFDNNNNNKDNALSTPNSTCTELQYTAEPIPPELAAEEEKQKKQSKPIPISIAVSTERKSIQGDDLTIESKPVTYSSSFPPMTEEGRNAFLTRRNLALKQWSANANAKRTSTRN